MKGDYINFIKKKEEGKEEAIRVIQQKEDFSFFKIFL
jgi:hypothetical protein